MTDFFLSPCLIRFRKSCREDSECKKVCLDGCIVGPEPSEKKFSLGLHGTIWSYENLAGDIV